MPTVSLTPQQQAQVDAANAALSTAQNNYNNSKALVDKAYKEMKAKYDNFAGSQCKYPFQPSLEAQLTYGTLNPKSCGNKIGCMADKCILYVGLFNTDYTQWKGRQTDLQAADQALAIAKANLNTVLDAIAKDPTHSINEGLAKDEIEAQKSKDNIKWMFFGLAAVIIIGVAIWIGTRMLRGGASA